jgi:hypothetical protein
MSLSLLGKTVLNSDADWDETQSARGENQQANRPGSSGATFNASAGGAANPNPNYAVGTEGLGGTTLTGTYAMGGGDHDAGGSGYVMGPAATNGTGHTGGSGSY